MGSWMMGLGMIWMVIFWAAIIGLVVWGALRLGTNNRPAGYTARSILDERYARGEIDEDEYRQLRRAITN